MGIPRAILSAEMFTLNISWQTVQKLSAVLRANDAKKSRGRKNHFIFLQLLVLIGCKRINDPFVGIHKAGIDQL